MKLAISRAEVWEGQGGRGVGGQGAGGRGQGGQEGRGWGEVPVISSQVHSLMRPPISSMHSTSL